MDQAFWNCFLLSGEQVLRKSLEMPLLHPVEGVTSASPNSLRPRRAPLTMMHPSTLSECHQDFFWRCSSKSVAKGEYLAP
ncbi:unnamed protein product [Leptosia nina]|uniref:Uncharacterized protein n=1 Tax=Leptosia nina TaxID=320188 RepID=A0AAV1JTT0_9NEOP